MQTKSASQLPKKAENKAAGKRHELSDAFKERVEKKYPFDEDVEEVFGALLVNGKLTLPNPQKRGDVGKTNDPRYCPYHQMVSHPLNQCFVVREKINEMWKTESSPLKKTTSLPSLTWYHMDKHQSHQRRKSLLPSR